MHPKIKGSLWLAVTFGTAFLLAFYFSTLMKMFPWRFELGLGRVVNSALNPEICRDQARQAVLEKILSRLNPSPTDEPSRDVRVQAIRGSTINAFATLGGNIYVYDGLIQAANNPEELASILAHEIEHVTERHLIQALGFRLLTLGGLALIFGSEGAPQLLHYLMHVRFSREEEAQADLGGFRRLQKAKIDPAHFGRFMERALKGGGIPEIISDHPATQSRIEMSRKFAVPKSEPVLSSGDWKSLRTICR